MKWQNWEKNISAFRSLTSCDKHLMPVGHLVVRRDCVPVYGRHDVVLVQTAEKRSGNEQSETLLVARHGTHLCSVCVAFFHAIVL